MIDANKLRLQKCCPYTSQWNSPVIHHYTVTRRAGSQVMKESSQGRGEFETVGITSHDRKVCDVVEGLGDGRQGLATYGGLEWTGATTVWFARSLSCAII